MANYVEVKNNNGTVTIDDTHPRMVKTRTITLATGYTELDEAYRWGIRGYVSNDYLLAAYSTFDISLNSNEKFVAIRAKRQRTNVAVFGGFVSSNKYHISLLSSVTNKNTYAGDFLVDIYGTVPSSGGTSSGLEVFNSSGTKIFDSDYYTMDVVGTYSVVNKEIEEFTSAKTSYSMGGHSIDNRAVVINSCINKIYRHPKEWGTPWASMLYGVVFGSTIHLEMRLLNGWLIGQGGGITPHGLSYACSGIILNTKNIT